MCHLTAAVSVLVVVFFVLAQAKRKKLLIYSRLR